MLRSRRISFFLAGLLLLGACGGSTADNRDRQRNSALEELCTSAPAGVPDPETGVVAIEFCEQAASYTLLVGNERESEVLRPTEGGTSLSVSDFPEVGRSVELVVRTAATDSFESTEIISYVGTSFIERVVVSLRDDNTVNIEKVEDRITSSTCVTINDNEIVPFTTTLQLITAQITCEGAVSVAVENEDGAATLEVEAGRVQYLAPRGEATYAYTILNSANEIYENGTLGLTGAPTRSTVSASGGTPPTGEGENQGEGATDTTVASEPADTTVPASGSEITLEEKWADCRNAPEFTLNEEEVARTGRLTYSVKWPCLKYMDGERFDQSVSHSFNDGSHNRTIISDEALKEGIDGDIFTFSAPIGAGSHEIVIGVDYNGFEHGWFDDVWFDRFSTSFTVDSETAIAFDQCSKSDIKISRSKLSMDCDVTGALELRVVDGWQRIQGKDGILDLTVLKDGWQSGYLMVESGAMSLRVTGVFCTDKCDVAASSVKVERTVGADNFSKFKVTRPSWCAEPIIAWLRGYTYRNVTRGVREEIESQMFWEDLEFGMVVEPEVSMIRIGDSSYWCRDEFGNWQTESVWADFFLQDEPAETPETTTTVDAPTTTAARVAGEQGPLVDVPINTMLRAPADSPAEIQVPSNADGIRVSAESIEAILTNAKTDVPLVLVTFDTGDRVALRRGRDEVLMIPAGAESVTFTAYKDDGTKVETNAKIATAKPLVKVPVNGSSSGGSGFPALPVGVALLVLLAGAAFVVIRRRSNSAGI